MVLSAAFLVICATVLPAMGSGKGPTMTSAYENPNGVAIWMLVDTAFAYDTDIGTHSFPVQKREKTVRIAIKDDLGLPAQGHVEINDAGPPGGDYFCGETDDPIEVSRGDVVNVLVLGGVCPGGSPSIATTGVVETTFAR